MVDEKRVIEFLRVSNCLGKPEDLFHPWVSFDPDTQERAAVDLHRFLTDDACLVEMIGGQAVFDAMVEQMEAVIGTALSTKETKQKRQMWN